MSFALLMMGAAAFFLFAYPDEKPLHYYHNEGHVFGTYYNIRYEAEEDLHEQILARLKEFDNSLSTFNEQSIISRINRGEEVKTDRYFEQMYQTAREVSELSEGAFDITVAPLVNAWGFGFQNKEQLTPERIEDLLKTVGYESVSLEKHHLIKQNQQTMLDASAIAKGQGCDVVAELLQDKGCKNFLVDIGGEVVLQGVNENNVAWRVGITKPQDDPTGTSSELQEVIASTRLCMATSGNYRQFYYEDGIRRSHTIDPRTGYPVNHSLLSATVTAPSCMRADALATACMVLGTLPALDLINSLPDTECYLIYAEGDSTAVLMTSGIEKLIQKNH